MKNDVRIGVIGTGRIGKLHTNNLVIAVPGAKVEAVADVIMNDQIKEWANSLGITKVYDNPDQIINDPEIDAVFICSSTNTHADLMIQAAKAGKDIFLRKTDRL